MIGIRSLVLLSLCWFATNALAIERLTLQVVCELAEQRYRDSLTVEEIGQIEADCAQRLANLLATRIGFLDFVSGSSKPNQLIVRLGKTAQEADPGEIRAVNFDIAVKGSDVQEKGEPVFWNFRSIAEYLQVPAPDTFADAITVRFGEELVKNDTQLVQNQLSRLMIADSAFPIPRQQSWLLPFSRDELKTADDSTFKIKAALIFPTSEERFTYEVVLFGDFAAAPDVPEAFHHKVKALHLGDDKLPQAASIERLKTADDVRILHVFVSRYVPPSAPTRTSPSNLAFDGPGGVP